jgi:hypothetical protein
MANGRMFMFASKYMRKGKQNAKRQKAEFLVRVNQREQIVQQTLTGFPCFLPCVISYLAYIFYIPAYCTS